MPLNNRISVWLSVEQDEHTDGLALFSNALFQLSNARLLSR